MPQSFQIRPCTEQDIPQITAIYRPEVLERTASWELEPPDEAEMMKRRAAILAGGYPYLVAAEGDRVLGYAYASAFRTRPAYRSTVENSIYVAPFAWRRGIARALMLALIDDCTARGFRQMIGVIGGSQNEASIKAHQSLGFEVIGTMKGTGYKLGQWLDTVLVQRALGEGKTSPPTIHKPK